MNNSLRFSSIILLILFFFTAFSTEVFSQNMSVDGAGVTPVNTNGVRYYIHSGTLNGKNKYVQDVNPLETEHTIWFTGLQWYISPSSNLNSPYYTAPNNAENLAPPSSGWTPVGKATSPAPTVNSTPLPVELVSFSAQIDGDVVHLNWKTATEVNNYGFEVQRALSDKETDVQNWSEIGFVEGNGNSNSPKEYSFTDEDLSGAKIVYYRLKQIDNDGSYDYSNVVEVNFVSPDRYVLSQNFPNPFNPSTKIKYKIASTEQVRLAVYNMLGQEVAVLVNETQAPGTYSYVFNATDLPSGIYLYKLETQRFSQTNKMLLLK